MGNKPFNFSVYVTFLVAGFSVFGLFSFVSAQTSSELFSDLPTTPYLLDITIIGDKYVNIDKFRQDAEKFKTALLAHEPFKSRANEITFHTIESKENLGCVASSDTELVPAKCDDAVVASIIKNSAVPTDKLIVLVDGMIGGGAGWYAVSGNSSMVLAVHELGHIFGLLDEYAKPDDGNGTKGDYCQGNCCFSSTCTDWKNVGGAMCIPGCGQSYWYRSSEDSIMNHIYAEGATFNAVSKKIIDEAISRYTNKIALQVFLTSPKDNLSVKGVIYPEAKAVFSEIGSIHKIEMYLDDKIFNSVNLGGFFSPGTTEWSLGGKALDTTLFPSGSRHVLYAKAYDHAGNVAVSPTATITVDNSPPSIAILEPHDGAMVSGLVPIKFSISDDSNLWPTVGLYADDTQIASAEPGKSELILNTGIFARGSKHRIYVKGSDMLGNKGASMSITVTIAESANTTDTKLQPDNTPFVISNIQISNGTNPDEIIIVWDTNKEGTSQIELLAGLCWGGVPCKIPPVDVGLTKHHSVTFSGSAPSTTYRFRIASQDADGNLAVSDQAFTTASTLASEFRGPGLLAQKFYRTLQRGIKSDEVKTLQEFLARSSDLYPEGLITGYFGPLTEAAVKRFQAKYGIVSSGDPATTGYGLVGPRTRSKLNELLK